MACINYSQTSCAYWVARRRIFLLIVLIADRRCGHVTGGECDERVACEGWKLDGQLQYHRVFATLGGGWLMGWLVIVMGIDTEYCRNGRNCFDGIGDVRRDIT